MVEDGSGNGRNGGAPAPAVSPRAALRIFLSYRRRDSPGDVHLLYKELIQAGFRRENLFRDIDQKAGVDFTEEIRRAVGSCSALIAVVGPHWLDARDDEGRRRLDDPEDWVRREIETALERDIPLIPICVAGAGMPKPGDLPEPLADFAKRQAITIAYESLDSDVERLIARLDEIARDVAGAPITNLRERNESFVGRDALLGEIEARLHNGHRDTAIVAIVGFPGYGKTQLAREYAFRHRDAYRVLWEVPAEQRTTRRERFGALARALGVTQRPDQDPVEAAREALEQSDDWLLIFDNAKEETDVEELLPRAPGAVLITSQRALWDRLGAETVPIDALTEEEASLLLSERLPDADKAELAAVAEDLLRIPLALEQAAAYMRKRHLPVSEFRKLYGARSAEVLDREAPRDYARTVMSTWRLVFEEVEERARQAGPGAVELLNLCGFLDPDGIELRSFSGQAHLLPEPLPSVMADELALADAVGLLADYSHLTWLAGGRISIHRVVQQFARDRLAADERRLWSDAAVGLVLASFPDDPTDVRSWDVCATLLPHATAALEHAKQIGGEPLNRARLLDRVGVFLQSGAQFGDARGAFERALRILSSAHDERHPDAATVRNHLGSLLRELGDLDGAQQNHEAALAVHEAARGPRSREAADDRRALARVLMDRDDLAGATDQLEKALEIHTSALGPDHRAVAEDETLLFTLLLRSGNVVGARSHLAKAVAFFDTADQADHPEAVFLRFLHGRLFEDTGETSALTDVIKVCEDAYGPNHPDVAEWKQWLADELLREGNVDEAVRNYEQALEIDASAYGETHWKVARDLLRLFVVQALRDEVDEAGASFRRAIAIFEDLPRSNGRATGGEVPRFVLAKFDEALDSLAAIHAAVGPFDRICTVVKTARGQDDPLYASALEHLGVELHEAGGREQLGYARTTILHALQMFASRYGQTDARVARSLTRLGAVEAALGDPTAATSAYENALAILESAPHANQMDLMTVLTELYPVLATLAERAAMGAASAGKPRHTATEVLERAQELGKKAVGVVPLVRLAEVLASAGKLEDARTLHEQVLAMVIETYGPERPIVADELNRLGEVQWRLGDLAAARASYQDALAIRHASRGEGEEVALDLVLRIAPIVAAEGDTEGAEASLQRGLAILDGIYGAEHAGLAGLRAQWWVGLGDAAVDAGRIREAAVLYERARDSVPAEEATLLARLGGIAAARGDPAAALELLRGGVNRQIADGSNDPFWSIVRAAGRAVRASPERRGLDQVLSELGDDPALDARLGTFRPRLVSNVPEEWRAKESMTLLAPDGQANVIASSEQLGPDIETERYAEVQGDLLRKEFPGYHEHAFDRIEVLGGRSGYIRHFEWSPPDGVRVSQLQLYYVEDGRGYTATATTPTSNFAALETELRQLLLRLRIAPAQ